VAARALLLEGHLDHRGDLTFKEKPGDSQIGDVLRRGGFFDDPRYDWESWDDRRLKDITLHGKTRPVAEAMFSWASALREQKAHGLLLYGPPGVGKSHLATLTGIYACIAYGTAGRYINWPEYVTRQRAAAVADEQRAQELKLELLSLPLVVVDDLFRISETVFSVSLLYDIVERKGFTLYTSNGVPDRWNPQLRNGDAEAARTTVKAIKSRLSTGRNLSTMIRMEKI